MTPEELANARALLPVPIGSGQTIKASGDAAVRRRKVVEMFPELIAHIDAQAGQIEAMKEKLVEERAQVLAGKGNLIWEPLPDDDRPDGLYPALVIRGKAYWRTVAHQQIEAEMVGVEWE